MDRQVIYAKTRDFMKRHGKNIIIYLVLYLILEGIIGAILGNRTISQIRIDMNQDFFDPNLGSAQFVQVTNQQHPILALLTNTINSFMLAGLLFSILEAYRTDKSVTMNTIINNLKENILNVLLLCLATAVVNYALGFIPLIGAILGTVFQYATIFALFIMKDNQNLNFIDSIQESFELTNGHKWNLFLIQLRYIVRVLLYILLGIILVMFFGVLGVILMVIVMVITIIRFMPLILSSTAIYYDLLVKGNQELKYDEIIVDATYRDVE